MSNAIMHKGILRALEHVVITSQLIWRKYFRRRKWSTYYNCKFFCNIKVSHKCNFISSEWQTIIFSVGYWVSITASSRIYIPLSGLIYDFSESDLSSVSIQSFYGYTYKYTFGYNLGELFYVTVRHKGGFLKYIYNAIMLLSSVRITTIRNS